MSRIVHNWKPIKVDEIEVASHRYTSNEVEASSARWFTSHFGIEIVSVTVENTITSSLKQPLAFFSKMWERVYAGHIQRGYQRAGLAPDMDGK